jgi:hypothetical protein
MIPINFNQILQQNSTIANDASFDDPRRVALHQSLWKKFTHFQERKQLDESMQKRVMAFFQHRYAFQDLSTFQKTWDKLGAQVWKPGAHLTAGIIREIDTKFRKSLVYHGEGIPASAQPRHVDSLVQKLVQALLHGGKFFPRLIQQRTAKAVLVIEDKELMKQFQQELQMELDHLSTVLPKNSQEEIVWRAFLGNILALLPFSYPSTGDPFTIPVLEQGICRRVNYEVDVLPLTYSSFSSPMTAVGLTPKEDPQAPSILSFIGTTFPAGEGFAATILSDFTPGHSVGEFVYERNKKKIDEWLANKTNVHACGMSLGGAMAFHALRRHHRQIGRLDVYNPPGLYANNWKREMGTSCDVNIYCQPGDVVSELGSWPTGDHVSLYTVFSHQKGVSADPISSHVRAFTGCKKITVIKEDPKEANRSFGRHLVTKMHQFLGPFIVFFPIGCTLLLYRLASSVHRVSAYCLKKIHKTFRPRP